MTRTIPSIVPLSALQNATTLYDFFMSTIEPDLVSRNLTILDVPYVGETPQEHDRRYERYTASFRLCQNAMKEFGNSTDHETKRMIQKLNEASEIEEVVGTLASISNSIERA